MKKQKNILNPNPVLILDLASNDFDFTQDMKLFIEKALYLNEEFLNERTVENEEGQYKWISCLFNFARIMKTHPSLQSMQGWESADFLDEYLNWEDFYILSDDGVDPRDRFIDAWDDINFPFNQGPLIQAISLTNKCYHLPERSRNGKNIIYANFISIAGHLQAIELNKNILLPLKKLSVFLKVTEASISIYRKQAIGEKYLKKIARHNRKLKRATKFRFNLLKCSEIIEFHKIDINKFKF